MGAAGVCSQHHLNLIIADNIAASIAPDGGRPSGCAWLDLIRISFATLAGPIREAYTPATHDTGWSHKAASWQAQCDALAALGAAAAQPLTQAVT